MLAASRLGLKSVGLFRVFHVHKKTLLKSQHQQHLLPPCAIRGISSGTGISTNTTNAASRSDELLSLEWTDARELVINASGEPTLASMGLGGWSPPGMAQSCFEYMHVAHNLPWWGTIVVGTVCVRLLLLPVVISSQRNIAKLTNVMPQMMHLQNKFVNARKSGNMIEAQQYSRELNNFMRDKSVNPFKNFLGPLAQMPFFISIFFGLREMAAHPVESMKTGGILWFQDLTVPDEFFALPILACATLYITIETSMTTQQMNGPNAKLMKNIFRVMPVIMLPFMSQFPSALLCYWVSTNTVTLIQSSILKIPAVKDYLNIPHSTPPPQLQSHQPPPQKDFATSMKESWNNIKVSKQLEEREHWKKVIAENDKKMAKRMNSIQAKKSKP